MGLGCVLMQHGKVVGYVSRQLKVHERNYPTYNLELVVMVFPLKIQRHYMYSGHVDVYTNLKSLQYYLIKRSLISNKDGGRNC